MHHLINEFRPHQVSYMLLLLHVVWRHRVAYRVSMVVFVISKLFQARETLKVILERQYLQREEMMNTLRRFDLPHLLSAPLQLSIFHQCLLSNRSVDTARHKLRECKIIAQKLKEALERKRKDPGHQKPEPMDSSSGDTNVSHYCRGQPPVVHIGTVYSHSVNLPGLHRGTVYSHSVNLPGLHRGTVYSHSVNLPGLHRGTVYSHSVNLPGLHRGTVYA